jgi:hypothetical protein
LVVLTAGSSAGRDETQRILAFASDRILGLGE